MNDKIFVKGYEFNNPVIQNMDYIFDDCVRDSHDKFFHTFDHICEDVVNFATIGNNEIAKFTISDKNMASYELNKKLTNAPGNGFLFNQINKLNIKLLSNLSHIIIHYYSKLKIPIMLHHFIRKLAQNPE